MSGIDAGLETRAPSESPADWFAAEARTGTRHLLAPAFRATFLAKRMIKTKPALWAAVQFVRRFRAG